MAEDRQLNFQRLCAYHYQRFWLKILHAIANRGDRTVTVTLLRVSSSEAPGSTEMDDLSPRPRAARWSPFMFPSRLCLLPRRIRVISSPDPGREEVFPEADLPTLTQCPFLLLDAVLQVLSSLSEVLMFLA